MAHLKVFAIATVCGLGAYAVVHGLIWLMRALGLHPF
jgi:hypothetical protein